MDYIYGLWNTYQQEDCKFDKSYCEKAKLKRVRDRERERERE